MISSKESKQVRINSWLLRLLSRDMKAKIKSKDQSTKNHKKTTEKQNITKKSNGKNNTYHGRLSQKWIDGTYRSLKVHSCRFENLPICSCSHKNNTLKISHS